MGRFTTLAEGGWEKLDEESGDRGAYVDDSAFVSGAGG